MIWKILLPMNFLEGIACVLPLMVIPSSGPTTQVTMGILSVLPSAGRISGLIVQRLTASFPDHLEVLQ